MNMRMNGLSQKSRGLYERLSNEEKGGRSRMPDENKARKKQADLILYQYGLWEEIKKYGVPHLIGSYRMDMMAWNDLDLDIENDAMSLDKLYRLSGFILRHFHPTWYEAKEEVTSEGKTVWFHGFETLIEGELWNVDLWFFDRETIQAAEKDCDRRLQQVNARPGSREQILCLKKDLIKRGLYSFGQYTSMDVYEAVLDRQITGIEEFLASRKRG